MRPPGWFRLMRAGAFAGVCVVVSLAGHDLMASRPAPLWAGWVAVAGVTGIGYCLAGRRRSLWWILLAVQVTQFCLHEWFSWAGTPGSAPARPALPMHDGMHAVAGSGATVGACGNGRSGSVDACARHRGRCAIAESPARPCGLVVLDEIEVYRYVEIDPDRMVERRAHRSRGHWPRRASRQEQR